MSPYVQTGGDVDEKRSALVGRFARLMEKSDGWVSLVPGIEEALARFQEDISHLPEREQRIARGGLFLAIADHFIDSAFSKGLSYERIEADITAMEAGILGRDG